MEYVTRSYAIKCRENAHTIKSLHVLLILLLLKFAVQLKSHFRLLASKTLSNPLHWEKMSFDSPEAQS